jgi:hypothetical protein
LKKLYLDNANNGVNEPVVSDTDMPVTDCSGDVMLADNQFTHVIGRCVKLMRITACVDVWVTPRIINVITRSMFCDRRTFYTITIRRVC